MQLKVIWPRQKRLLDCLVVLCSEQGETDNLKVITASSLSDLNILNPLTPGCSTDFAQIEFFW